MDRVTVSTYRLTTVVTLDAPLVFLLMWKRMFQHAVISRGRGLSLDGRFDLLRQVESGARGWMNPDLFYRRHSSRTVCGALLFSHGFHHVCFLSLGVILST